MALGVLLLLLLGFGFIGRSDSAHEEGDLRGGGAEGLSFDGSLGDDAAGGTIRREPSKSPCPRSVSILDLEGSPVVGERVLVLSAGGATERRTDGDGVLAVPAGNLLILADGSGQLAREVLVVRETEDDLVIEWPTACSLVVEATDEHGDPVEGLPVALALAQPAPDGGFEVTIGPRDQQLRLWKRLLARLTTLSGAEALPRTESELDAVWRSFADLPEVDLRNFMDGWVGECRGSRWVGFPYAGIRRPHLTDGEGIARWSGLPGGLPIRFFSAVKTPMLPDPYPEGEDSLDYPIAPGDSRSPQTTSAAFVLPKSGVRHASIVVLRNASVRARLPTDFSTGLRRARAVLLAVGKEKGSRATRLDGQILTNDRRELEFPVVPPGRKHLVALYPIRQDRYGLVGRFFELGVGESKDLGTLPPEGPGACIIRIVPYDAFSGQEILPGDPRLPQEYWQHYVTASLSATRRQNDEEFLGLWIELRPDMPLRIDGLSLGRWSLLGGIPGFMDSDLPQSLRQLDWGPVPSAGFEIDDSSDAVEVELRIPVKGYDYVPVELLFEKAGDYASARRYRLSLYREGESILETDQVTFGGDGTARVSVGLPPGRITLFLRPRQGTAQYDQGGFVLQEISVGRDGRTSPIPVHRGIAISGKLVPVDGAAVAQTPMESCDLDSVLGLPKSGGSGRGDYVFQVNGDGSFFIVGVPPNARLRGRHPWSFDLNVGAEDQQGLEVPCRFHRSR